jgi:hypothetical protein
MIPEERVAWQAMPEENRQQVIMILVEILLRELAVKPKEEAGDEGGE